METKKDLSCDIVKDLLPVYCDGQASKDSIEAVEEHLEQCEECKKVYEEMDGELTVEGQQDTKKEITILKKIRAKFRVKTVFGFFIGVATCVALFFMLFVGVIPAKSDEVTITYEAYMDKTTEMEGEPDEKEVDQYCVVFHIALPDGKTMNFKNILSEEEQLKSGCSGTYQVYSVLKLPFDDRGKEPNKMECGFESTEPFSENDKVTFRFRDKSVTYNLKKIAKEAGIQ